MCHRYRWAADQCEGRDVLEVACGAGQGLAVLQDTARSLSAGDFSPEVLANAQDAAGGVPLSCFGAEALPFPDNSFDCVLLFEALYYVDPGAFFSEARRVVRDGGKVLIVTANKDLFDFTPSPFTKRYLGAAELQREMDEAGFNVELFGYLDTSKVGWRQRILRPVKALASKLGLMPKTMRGKEWLKKLFFGSMVDMPASLKGIPFDYAPPKPISGASPDHRHKVIYCRGTIRQKG